MGRYTKRDARTGRAYLDEKGAWLAPDGTIQGCAIEDLAEYEDIDLTPEELKQIFPTKLGVEEARERAERAREIYGEWYEYKKAEAEGRLIVLPVKVGDTVWAIFGDPLEIHECKVRNIFIWKSFINSISETKIRLKPVYGGDKWFECSIEYFGHTIFSTPKAAEAKLKEVQQG